MRNFIKQIAAVEMMNTTLAVQLFGLRLIKQAYNKGRITFEGEFVVFVQ